jgi:SAM-dependent methyltransferase
LAQQLIYDFIAELRTVIELPEPIVEFGSLQVEPDQPGDLRPLFDSRTFIGTDMRFGPGVDRVEDLRALGFANGEVGTALCLDTLEHCEDPLTACRELHRVTADHGICVIASVMWFPIHGYPHDYWRFTPEGFAVLLAPFSVRWVAGIGHPELPTQVIGVASKGTPLELSVERLASLSGAQRAFDRAEGKVRFGPVHVSPTELARGIARDLPRAVAQRARARISERS